MMCSCMLLSCPDTNRSACEYPMAALHPIRMQAQDIAQHSRAAPVCGGHNVCHHSATGWRTPPTSPGCSMQPVPPRAREVTPTAMPCPSCIHTARLSTRLFICQLWAPCHGPRSVAVASGVVAGSDSGCTSSTVAPRLLRWAAQSSTASRTDKSTPSPCVSAMRPMRLPAGLHFKVSLDVVPVAYMLASSVQTCQRTARDWA
jgi:hypothetical protein